MPGKSFHMDVQEVGRSEDLIQGTCEVNGKILTVLYDLGASHSFVSRDCMSPIFELPYDLLVSSNQSHLYEYLP